MNFLINRKTVKSQQFTRAITGGFQVPMQFLEPAITGMQNPMIIGLRARVALSCATGTQGGPARQFSQVFSRVLIQDGAGDRFNGKGSSLRLANYAQRPGQHRDGLNIAASQGSATQSVWIDLFPMPKLGAMFPWDHGLLVSDLLNGGQIYLTWGQNTTFTNYITFAAATGVEVYADVVDATDSRGKRYLPPRLCWREESVSVADYRYKCGGLLRESIYYIGDQSEDTQQQLAAQNFYSEDLRIPGWPVDYFKERARNRGYRLADSDAAQTVGTEDPFVTASPQAIMLAQPDIGQAIADLPIVETYQVKTDASVGSLAPVVLTSYYTKRAPELEAAALGEKSIDTARSRIAAGIAGERHNVSAVLGGKAPFLPVWA